MVLVNSKQINHHGNKIIITRHPITDVHKLFTFFIVIIGLFASNFLIYLSLRKSFISQSDLLFIVSSALNLLSILLTIVFIIFLIRDIKHRLWKRVFVFDFVQNELVIRTRRFHNLYNQIFKKESILSIGIHKRAIIDSFGSKKYYHDVKLILDGKNKKNNSLNVKNANGIINYSIFSCIAKNDRNIALDLVKDIRRLFKIEEESYFLTECYNCKNLVYKKNFCGVCGFQMQFQEKEDYSAIF